MQTDEGPIDFTWLNEGRLAAFPVWALHDLDALQRAGITAIVSLTEHFPHELVGERRFRTLHLPVLDMTAPATAQIEEFVEFVEQALSDGLRVGVHCLAGLGRTGTMIACYLVSQGASPEEAIAAVRSARPGSVQTEVQERAVRGWARRLSGQYPSDRYR